MSTATNTPAATSETHEHHVVPLWIYFAVFGALIVGVFESGLRLAGLDVQWQVFAIGWLIILAVAIDQWIRKVSA